MKENGRVTFKDGNNQFLLSDKFRNKQEVTPYSNSMKGLWYNTVLSNTYFSAYNIKYVQDNIRYNVYKQTNNIIDYQNLDTLKNIMRAIFLKYSENRKEDLKNQILTLNDIVINFCVKEVTSGLDSYLKYIRDVSRIPDPIQHPNNTGIKGEEPLELRRFY